MPPVEAAALWLRVPARKLHRLFTLFREKPNEPVSNSPAGRNLMVGAIAIAMFVGLVGFGGKYFGWEDPDGKVQLALVTSFILGIIGGFKAKG
jgi:hypothetical protein